MAKNTKLVGEVLDNFFEGFTLDEKGKLKVVNENAASKASEALSKLVLEQSRDWWDQLEAAEDSLSHLSDEISFEEMNADPAQVDTDITMAAPDTADVADAVDAVADPTLGEGEEDDLSKLLGSDDFDLDSIFEMDHLDGDKAMMADGQGHHYEDEGEEDVTDGDEDFDDLKIGMDDADMGGGDMEGDAEMDAIDGEGDEFAGDDMNGGEMGMDDLEGDLEGGDMDLDGGDMTGGDFDDFDFNLLDDEEEEAEEGYGMREMGHDHGHDMKMKHRGMHESDDEDEDDDNDDDDKKKDDEDDD